MFTQLYSTQLFQIINVYKEKCSSICYHSYVALLNGFFTIYMEAWFLKGGKGERDRGGDGGVGSQMFGIGESRIILI